MNALSASALPGAGSPVTAQPFPLIDTVPLGTPGNPNIYAKPQTPRNFTG